jgi:hypothetical protein
MKKITFLLLLLSFGILTFDAAAQKGKPKPSPTPSSGNYVKAEFLTTGADGMLNKITMDTATPYEHGVNGVSAQFFIGGSRDLVIQLLNSQRFAWYDMSQVADATNAPNWVYTIQPFKPQLNVLEAYKVKEDCQPVDGIYNCDFKTRMNTGYMKVSGLSRTTFAVLWNPETENPRPVNSPEMTSFVNVNYYKGFDGQEVFTITALPNCATRANNFTCSETDTKRVIAGLEDTTGKTVRGAGQYVMPFTLVVRPK